MIIMLTISKSFTRILKQLFSLYIILLFVNLSGCTNKQEEILFKGQYEETPNIVWWTDSFGINNTRYCQNIKASCKISNDKSEKLSDTGGAYIFYASSINFTDLPLPRSSNHIWALLHEESPRNVEELLHEAALKLFNFTSTFSRYSDVPFPLQYIEDFEELTSDKYFVSTNNKNKYLDEIAPVLYLQSDCDTSSERDKYVKELMKLVKVDSYGSCLNNKSIPEELKTDYLNKLNEDNFLNFVSRYKFVIAIENGVCDDYVTEKFWRAIKVGTVPIYFGSPSIKYWLPNENTAILIQDYPSPTKIKDLITELLNNDTLYESYLEHKINKVITNQNLIIETKKRPYQNNILKVIEEFECFICEKIHKRLGGDMSVHIASKSHYNCSIPISTLTQSVNPANSWVYSYNRAGKHAKEIYQRVFNNI